MDFCRARESEFKHIKYEKSIIHNTTLIACEDDNVIGVLEYDVNSVEEAEVTNFNIFEPHKSQLAFKGLIEELLYWNPYLKRIIYNEDRNVITRDVLKYAGFRKGSVWLLDVDNNIEVFRVNIEEITPEQLTVSKAKIDKVSKWIEEPEDIVITCVEIGDKVVCIDGYSRLVAAYIKGFKYVYAYLENENDSIEFYKTCMKWCEKQNIFTIEDLANRIVTPEEHERLWINKCQTYLKGNVNS
ncbi:hypothetical protein [Proteiniborus sp. MB09-C3]|uniref:hypothetical protein n=1 Tax=Proteiniborus sp. MB09-C3 TaxID=3050072 RepID=UPI0025552E98|nr:hypothetical protein [Proteiniborus sp. MB09-C3]WIV11056.1 hypothetical protein QO263_12945 [Proteiniborus sp. MB09-C3]